MVNTILPPAGTPGVFDPRQPTLIPNFDRNIASSTPNAPPTVSHSSPAAFLASNPRVSASATATIGGTVTTSDTITIAMSNPVFPGGVISHTYTTVGGDSVTTIAEALAALFDNDPTAAAFEIEATAAGAVVTFAQSGPVGNFSVLSKPTESPGTITIGGTALTGDVIAVLFAGAALGPIAPAVVLAALGGTFATSDTVALTFTNAAVTGLPVTKTYTVVAGDTAETVATGLAALINADATLGAADIVATVVNGVELSISQQGAIGNSTVVTRAVSGSETVTFIPSNGHMVGGTGQPGGVLVTSNTTTSQSTTTMATNLTTAINANADLIAAGITATSSAAVITLTLPAAAEPVTVTSWVNTITPTATITGTVAAADVLNLTFTGTYIAGSPVTISHTTLLGETTTTLATNLTAQINASAVLQAAGISATSSTNVITFKYVQANGQIRFGQSVSPGSETITITTTPSETSVVSTAATETVTFAPTTGVMSGGSGPVFAANNFEFAPAYGGVSAFFYGQPYLLSYDLLTQMVNQGMPIV